MGHPGFGGRDRFRGSLEVMDLWGSVSGMEFAVRWMTKGESLVCWGSVEGWTLRSVGGTGVGGPFP
jgi:hypothetical protein